MCTPHSRYARLHELLTATAPEAPILPGWRLGGGLYLQFLTTMSAQNRGQACILVDASKV